jgi:lipopolysaccharide/colanic/teichoic acid biosynthesis glycosyltransferase
MDGMQMEKSSLRMPLATEPARRRNGQNASFQLTRRSVKPEALVPQETFHSMLTLERRRAERSRKPFVLMLVDAHGLPESRKAEKFLRQLTSVVSSLTRETDVVGWYKENVILGVIFTEVSLEGKRHITDILSSKVVSALHKELGRELSSHLIITLHLFPESGDPEGEEPIADIKLYPDLSHNRSGRQFPLVVKRFIDVVGSGALLLLLSPILLAIAIAIKLTSQGPVIFEQERLGHLGARFKCLKFRTMYVNNDPKIHQEYVQRFIAGQAGTHENKDQGEEEPAPAIYKLTSDPRVTPVGRILRKLSFDELPQFWNVLRGEMSLVGPRPPVPYEFEVYDIWHRRRVLELKPGVTGLWQVSGRSRTRFEEMVRLDLRYSQSWSLWLDLKILLATPRAVFTGDGAY